MMKKTKKRLTRLLAICVCLIVVLSACASAPSGESTVSVTTEESKETSALELSEVNAESTSSEAEPSAPEGHISADSDATLSGDITITPVEPTYPEERETTLEFVKEYPLGERGIPFYLEYYDDPEYAGITTPLDYFIDENGKLFAQMGRFILDIEANDAVELKNSVSGWYVSNGNIYSVTYDGMLEVYSPEGELISSVQIVEKNSFKNINIYPTDGSPIVRVDSALFSSDGKIVTDRFTMGENQNVLTVNGVANAVELGKGFWVMSDQNGLLTVINHRYTSFENRNWVDEYIFYQFGADGNPISEFAVYQLWTPENLPRNVVSGDAVCKWYRGQTCRLARVNLSV